MDVQKFVKSKGVHHFVSHTDKQAVVVERFNRTLKKIWTYFRANQTNLYIDKLEDFEKSYNHSVHWIIGIRPGDISVKDQDPIWGRLYGNNLQKPKRHSAVGSLARINKLNGAFEKGYIPTWRAEHFHIKKRIRKPNPVYKLTDEMRDDIKGEFYEEDRQPIEENRYLIERIRGKRSKLR